MTRARLSDADLFDLGAEAAEELLPRAEAATRRGAERIVQVAKQNLSRVKGTAKTAAPAGQAPEYDEGDLARSMEVGRTRRTKTSVRTEYGSDHESAGLHEFGGTVTQDGVKRTYPPRPYLRPAEATTEDEVTRILEEL